MKQAQAVARKANIFAQPLELNFDAHKKHAICIHDGGQDKRTRF